VTYASPRYIRFLAWCRRRGKRPTWLQMSYWIDDGEPEARDRYAGTVLDQMVQRDMMTTGQLPLFEGE